MADEIKSEYARLYEKKHGKAENKIDVDEFEWTQVGSELLMADFVLLFTLHTVLCIAQGNAQQCEL
jgi:hypothetical protein